VETGDFRHMPGLHNNFSVSEHFTQLYARSDFANNHPYSHTHNLQRYIDAVADHQVCSHNNQNIYNTFHELMRPHIIFR